MHFDHVSESTYLDLEFPSPPPDRPYAYLNMVASIDGKAVVTTSERGLGSRTDQRLMRRLRYHADVVLAGAGTHRASGSGARIDDERLRAERVRRGKSENPVAALVTNGGFIETSTSFFTAGDFEAVVFIGPGVGAGEQARLRATGRRVVRIGEGLDGLREMTRYMRREMGAARLCAEGGPTMCAEMLRAGLIDEFFVTLVGKVVGGKETLTIVEGARFGPEDLPEFEPVSVVYNPEAREFYFRWRRVG